MNKKSILVGALAFSAFTMGTTNSFANVGTGMTNVSVEANCGDKKTETKTKEGKCGEGKCGGKKTEAKTKEGKCGEGKCGDKKTKKDTTKTTEKNKKSTK